MFLAVFTIVRSLLVYLYMHVQCLMFVIYEQSALAIRSQCPVYCFPFQSRTLGQGHNNSISCAYIHMYVYVFSLWFWFSL